MIRACEYSKLYELAVLHADVRKDVYKGILTDEYLETLTYSYVHDKWKRLYKREDREILIYEEKGEILGFIAFSYWNVKTGHSEVLNLHVKKEARRKGIGKALIAAVAGILKKIGISELQVCVVEGNVNAESFYKSLGAVEIGRFTEMWGQWEAPQKRLVWYDTTEMADDSMELPTMFCYDGLNKAIKKEFALFGAGEYCDAFFEQFPNCIPHKIFDNNPQKWGMLKHGVFVEKPVIYENVIIATRFYSEIKKQLTELGCENVSEFYPWHKYNNGE